MDTLYAPFGLSRQQSSSRLCFHGYRSLYRSDCLAQESSSGMFFFSTATLQVQLELSHQQSRSGIICHGYNVCSVRTVSPTEQLWDVFQRLRCMYSSNCLANRLALVCFSMAALHVQFGLSLQQNCSGMCFQGYQHEHFGLSHRHSSSRMFFMRRCMQFRLAH